MIHLASRPGSATRPNEDWCGGVLTSSGQLLVVLDGVTAPTDTGCLHGTPWYVNQLGIALINLASDERRTLTDALGDAIACVTEQHADSCDTTHRGSPAAAVAVARASGTCVDHLVLADTTIAITTRDGVRTFSDSRVDAVTAADAKDALAHPIGTDEQIASVQRMGTNQQSWRNHDGGYWVAAADAQAAEHAYTGRTDNAEGVALFSDGASRIVDVLGQQSWEGAMAFLRHAGPEALIDQVREVELSDPAGSAWPRFKASDDACIAYSDLTRWILNTPMERDEGGR